MRAERRRVEGFRRGDEPERRRAENDQNQNGIFASALPEPCKQKGGSITAALAANISS